MLGFAPLMQEFRGSSGKAGSVQCIPKDVSAQDWPGLWMRVDREMIRVAGRDRDFFGVLLAGSGSVWTNNAKSEVVGPTVLTADGETFT